jgi:hypothetical protein
MPIRYHIPRLDRENRALILLKFRDGQADSFESLGKVIDRVDYHTLRVVHELVEAGLLQADDASDLRHTKIRVSEQLSRIHTALGLSLTFLANFDHSAEIAVEPMFGLPKWSKELEKLDVFVLMPFKEELSPVYEDHIKPTCTKLGLTVRRGDDYFTTHAVLEDIWAAICSARLVIADCTDRNPNVFYEIGVAHTIGQPTILLTQRPEDVPFDLRHFRYIQYQLTPRGMKEFEKTLDLTIRNSIDTDEVA